MTTLSIYVGRSDANGRPLAPSIAERLANDLLDAFSFADATELASGTLRGRDEQGVTEESWHYLVDVPTSASLLALFRSLAKAVRRSRQRSFGVVGWSSATVVPVDPSAVDAWYLTGQVPRS